MFHGATAEQRQERLGRFLHRLAPTATIFGLTEYWLGSRFEDETSRLAALVILLYSGIVLIAARLATAGSIPTACTLASISTLAAALVLVFVTPGLHAALVFAPMLAAVIAYPYLVNRALVVVLASALAATGVIALVGSIRPPATNLPATVDLSFRTATAIALAGFVAYFLWQYRLQVEHQLRGMVGRREELERAVTELTGLEREARRLALRDPLTGIANRRLLLDRLEETLGAPNPEELRAALVFVDLDDFKKINDELGHANGDAVLLQIAQVLQGAVRKTDLLARFGGDEFAVLMPRVGSGFDPEQLAKRLLARLEQQLDPLELDERVTASIGLALAPEHGATPEQLLRAADAAMYRAKLAGGAGFAWPVEQSAQNSDESAASA